MKFIVFGTGSMGRKIQSYLGDAHICCFTDSYAKGDHKIGTIPVRSIEQVKAMQLDGGCTIVATAKEFEDEVIEFILSKGIENYLLMDEIRFNMIKDDGRKRRNHIRAYEALKCFNEYSGLTENRDSQIELYVTFSSEVSHYVPIYKALLSREINAEIVVEPCLINTVGEWIDYDETIDLLRREGIRWRSRCNSNASIAITTQFGRTLGKYKRLKAQLSYGASFLRGVAFQLEPDVIRDFDLILTNGEFYASRQRQFLSEDAVMVIGYPRYISFFDDPPSKRKVMDDLGIKTEKKIVLYYPTWDEYSSISVIRRKLELLRGHYYIVCKPHPCTANRPEKTRDLETLKQSCDMVLPADYNLAVSTIIGDVAIIDGKSGAVSEVAFLNPKLPICLMMCGTKTEEYWVDYSDYAIIIDDCEDVYATIKKVMDQDPFMGNRREQGELFYASNLKGALDQTIERLMDLVEM